jgi:hypoxanthine phosphoribosyltransferase
MHDDIEEVLISEPVLQARIASLAAAIQEDYAGRDLLLVGILRGGVMFMADLARQLDMPLEMDFMATSSYGTATESSGVVRILKDLDTSVEGRHILIVEDIIDSGLTLKYLMENLARRNPANIAVCALLDRRSRTSRTSSSHNIPASASPTASSSATGWTTRKSTATCPTSASSNRACIRNRRRGRMGSGWRDGLAVNEL